MEKLVRDKMPELCSTVPGWTPMTWRSPDNSMEFKRLLTDKLVEEAKEVQDACASQNTDKICEELADLEEVVRAIRHKFSLTAAEVERVRKAKLERRGGFTKGVVWDGNK
jgi:predicted house-cleaning noncanonical NTP pyrophosphatase (MazG superfamily)